MYFTSLAFAFTCRSQRSGAEFFFTNFREKTKLEILRRVPAFTPEANMGRSILERLNRIDPVIEGILDVTGAPSVSLGVSYNGIKVRTAGYVRRDTEAVKPDENTLYGIGSITEMFIASAIGLLVSDDKLEWTTPVRKILPEFETSSVFITQELTVVDLLSHRTGLATPSKAWYGASGEVLLDNCKPLPAFSCMKSIASFRTRFDYNDWNFALLGEIIKSLTGQSYHIFIRKRILTPLGLERTFVKRPLSCDGNVALPYTVLQDKSKYEHPRRPFQKTHTMAPAVGIQSTVNDMLSYSQALLSSYKFETQRSYLTASKPVLKEVVKQFTSQIACEDDSAFQKARGLGLYLHQLPNSFDALGCNSIFVNRLPIIRPGENAGLVLSHAGRLAGFSAFLGLLPEMDCSFVILVNSVGLGDPAGWIFQLLIESLVDSPSPNDYIRLAHQAAISHASTYKSIEEELKHSKTNQPLSKPPRSYVGRYRDTINNILVDVRLRPGSLSQLFFELQDSKAQTWDLKHYDTDRFIIPLKFDSYAEKAMFTFPDNESYMFKFHIGDTGLLEGLYWAYNPEVPAAEQYLLKWNIFTEIF